MIAHVGGAPVEELLVPLVSTAGVLLVAARASWSARRRRRAEAGVTAESPR